MDFPFIINTVKGFLSKPSEEWQKIKASPITKGEILMKIIIPLVVVYTVAFLLNSIISCYINPFIRYIGFGRILVISLVRALLSGAMAFGLIYGGSFALYALADNFKAKKDDTLTLKVIAFSYLVALASSVALIIPVIGLLVLSAGSIYSLILLYWGMRDLLEPPQDKLVVYFIVTLLILILGGALLSVIMNLIIRFIPGSVMF